MFRSRSQPQASALPRRTTGPHRKVGLQRGAGDKIPARRRSLAPTRSKK
nr:MAG TPA: hypothetical protein [Caudoviricetes sp.]